MKRHQVFLVLGFLVLLTLFITPLWWGIESVEDLKVKVAESGPLAPAMFVVVVAAESIVPFFPGIFLTMFGGYLFGVFIGAILSLTGTLIGSSIIYYLATNLSIIDWFHHHETARFKGFIHKHRDWGIFLARISLFFPGALVSFYAGLTEIRYSKFILLTAIGSLPVILIFSIFGSGLTGLWEIKLWPFSAVVVLLLTSFFWRRTRA